MFTASDKNIYIFFLPAKIDALHDLLHILKGSKTKQLQPARIKSQWLDSSWLGELSLTLGGGISSPL